MTIPMSVSNAFTFSPLFSRARLTHHGASNSDTRAV